MKLLGLIGYPLSHSFSKKYFTQKFVDFHLEDFRYELFPLERIDLLPDLLLKNPDLIGLNVTIPYKEAVIPFLDELDPAAREIGAVNTIRIEDQKLVGYNTDVLGFENSLKKSIKSSGLSDVSNALILGSGGAAKAVEYVLKKLKINPLIISRSPTKGDLTYEELTESIIQKNKLIINTTPLGMKPNISSAPDIPYEMLNSSHLLFDLVYNPKKTLFLLKGEARGTWIRNGLQMLYGQAEEAWGIWTHLDTQTRENDRLS